MEVTVARTATITAVAEVRTLSFDGPTFVAAVTGYMGSAAMVGSVADALVAENEQRRQSEQ